MKLCINPHLLWSPVFKPRIIESIDDFCNDTGINLLIYEFSEPRAYTVKDLIGMRLFPTAFLRLYFSVETDDEAVLLMMKYPMIVME